MDLEDGRRPDLPFAGSLCTQMLPRTTIAILTSKNFGSYLFIAALITLFLFFSKEISTGVLLWICLLCSAIATCLRLYVISQRRRILAESRRFASSLFPLNLQLALVDRDFDERDYETLLGLDSDNPNTHGASTEQISRLPVSYYDKKQDAESHCSICLDVMTKGEQIRTLPCLHFYHTVCVDKWLIYSATCPVCKCSIV